MAQFYTITEVAALLGVSYWRIKNAVDKLGIEVPRHGASYLIPATWLPAIEAALLDDRRRKKIKRASLD